MNSGEPRRPSMGADVRRCAPMSSRPREPQGLGTAPGLIFTIEVVVSPAGTVVA